MSTREPTETRETRETREPLPPSTVLRKYLKEWAFVEYDKGVPVAKKNVSFIKNKMIEHGNPDFIVTCSPYKLMEK